MTLSMERSAAAAPGTTTRSRQGRGLSRPGWIVAGLLVAMAGALVAAGCYFHAVPGEWAWTLHARGLSYRLSVDKALRLATQPRIISWLDGRVLETRIGAIVLAAGPRGQLLLRCSPCIVPARALSEAPVRLARVRASVHREGNVLRGGVLVGSSVQSHFVATLARGGMDLEWTLLPTPMRDLYALFAADIPELRRARIDGEFGARLTLRMPERELHLVPTLAGFRVHGLGTESLRRRLPVVACGTEAGTQVAAPMGRWLGKAVIAAEDQRFWQHTGFDLREATLSLQRNQAGDAIARGGSTLPQQLAKLLFTGGERTHVRKLRELLYAVEMEATLGKPRILQLYLTVAPWGRGVCGAEMAARAYYGKPATAVGRAEAAWLAAMLHTPDREVRRWRATGHPNLRRAAWVVDGMGTGPRRRREAVILLASLAPPAAGPVAWPASR